MKSRFFIAILVLLLASCSDGGSRYRQLAGTCWGTTYHITAEVAEGISLADSVTAVIDSIDSMLSPFREDSEISAVNRAEAPVAVSPMFADVFRISQKVNALSGGIFDPTVAPLVNLWGFGYRNGDADIPADEDIAEALTKVGIADCSLSPDMVLTKKDAATEFNFSAVAKGYGVDRVAAMLRRCGSENFMVEIGGEIVVAGKNPRGEDWRIQLDAPVDDNYDHQGMTVLPLTDCAMATSGNYRNYRDTAAGRVAHTISPVTGRPILSTTLSATVIAPTCAVADALATACMALPADSAAAVIRAFPDTRAIMIVGGDSVGNSDFTRFSVIEIP